MIKALKAGIDLAKVASKSEVFIEMETLAGKGFAELMHSAISAKRFSSTNIVKMTPQLETLEIPKLEMLALQRAARGTKVDVASTPAGAERVKEILVSSTNLSLVGKMERGTHGAWLVKDKNGLPSILKVMDRSDVRPQIQQAELAARAVDSLAGRTPQFSHIGFVKPHGSWYVQEFLPGFPSPAPTERLVSQMLRINERQANAGAKLHRNWSDEVMDALYKDSKGWQKNIANSGPEGKAFISEVSAMVDRNRFLVPRTGDIVHGDFQHYNALVSRTDRLTGYIDWDGAGKGDRAIDLSRLLYDAYVSEVEIGFKANPQLLSGLRTHIEQVSGHAAFENYMNFWAMQVADFGVKGGPVNAKMFIGVGRRILQDLKNPSIASDIAI